MKKIDYRDFVVEWCTSSTLDDLMRSQQLTKPQIRYHAKRLRASGVVLPELKPAMSGLDRLTVAQLNSLVRKHTK